MNMVPADINIIPKDSCQCGIPRLNCDNAQSSDTIELPLAMATIPFQQFKNLNDARAWLTNRHFI